MVPFGLLLALMIIFTLFALHKSIRTTKIYDNCTSSSANYVYHIELRTGDTSVTYNRRKATITIDMFDENQVTLARIAVPGHVIFGRKESPVDGLDDDRFVDLRVTRLWLYRSSKLKRVATIRLTHTCAEPESRIMIYGVELRTDDEDRHRLFFPVMNYITAYGTVGRPNACYDADPLGTISVMGSYPESSSLDERLNYLDYSILAYFFCALVLYLSTMSVFKDSFKDRAEAAYKGAALGFICFSACFAAGLLMRYFFKHYYSLSVGRGFWAVLHHMFIAILLLVSTVIWLYATYSGYKFLCSNEFSKWLLSILVAVVESIGFCIVCATVAWMLVSSSTVYAEQFVMPEEPSGGKQDTGGTTSARKTTQSLRSAQQVANTTDAYGARPKSPMGDHSGGGHQGPTVAAVGAAAVAHPWHTTGGPGAMPVNMLQPPPTINFSHGAANQLYGQSPYMMISPQPMSPGVAGGQTSFKVPFTPPATYPPAFDGTAHFGGAHAQQPAYGHYGAVGHLAPQPSPPPPQAPSPPAGGTTATAFHTMGLPKPLQKQSHGHHSHHHQQANKANATYQQQVGAAGGGGGGGSQKQASGKKVGSQESTGSTYYQQLMKNKGGVKSISQYGELLKKNKK